jgi:hypothetical protein
LKFPNSYGGSWDGNAATIEGPLEKFEIDPGTKRIRIELRNAKFVGEIKQSNTPFIFPEVETRAQKAYEAVKEKLRKYRVAKDGIRDLRDFIGQFPGTKAAAEAQKILKSLGG